MLDELAQTYAHYATLRRELSLWVEQSIRRDGPDQNHGGEDEANFALAFFPHYLVSGDERIAVRFRSLANDLKAWVRAECLHGYEPEAEAHHGTEPFLLFLPRYLGLFPDDTEAAALLDDAAHHIGNWIEEVPAWYDWRRDVFLSYWIGTRTVGGSHGDRELAEHFRFLHIALAAYRVTGEGPLPRLGTALWAQTSRAVARGGRTDARIVESGRARIAAGGFADPRRAGDGRRQSPHCRRSARWYRKSAGVGRRSTRWAISFC